MHTSICEENGEETSDCKADCLNLGKLEYMMHEVKDKKVFEKLRLQRILLKTFKFQKILQYKTLMMI